MRKILLLILTLTFFACNSQDEKNSKQMNVLFIGNSLTYYNDMPGMLQKMMNEKNLDINIEQITYPGFSLYAHLENIVEEGSENQVRTRKKSDQEITETEKKIQEKEWDIIIMQTGGVTILIPEIRKEKVDPAIKEIMSLSNSNSKFILFNTWTTKINYPKEYCYSAIVIDKYSSQGEKICSPEIANGQEYFDALQSGYRELSDNNNISLTRHAQVFQETIGKYPEIDLLEDAMHPSKEGAFLSACLFYKLISGKDPKSLEYTAGLDVKTTDLMKRASS